MDLLDLLRTFGALAVVIGLMVGALYALRRWGGGWLPIAPAGAADRRLAVIEQLAIDPKRRLVLVRRDSAEHLLLLTAEGAIVVETGRDA